MALITYKFKANLLRYIKLHRRKQCIETQLLDALEKLATSERDGRYTKKQLEQIKACMQELKPCRLKIKYKP